MKKNHTKPLTRAEVQALITKLNNAGVAVVSGDKIPRKNP
jgi:hypothetical protein